MTKTDPERAIEFIPYGAADKIKLSVKIIQNIVAVPTKSGATCTERDALRFLMLCQAQRLNPFAGDAYLVGYDGKNGPNFSLITAHQAFLKRAETCPDFEGMESGIIILDENGETIQEREGDFHLETEKVVGGWARVHRKNRKDTYRRIRLNRFNNGYAQWQVDPAGMIVKCAEADALRSTFPTLLGGLYMQGEMDSSAGKIVADMSISRPVFEAKTVERIADTPAARQHQEEAQESAQAAADDDDIDRGPRKTAAQPAPQQESEPEPARPEPIKASAEPDRQVKAIKNLLKLSGCSEVELMDLLHAQGLDDSVGTLSEMGNVAAQTLARVHDGWPKYLAALKQAKAATK